MGINVTEQHELLHNNTNPCVKDRTVTQSTTIINTKTYYIIQEKLLENTSNVFKKIQWTTFYIIETTITQ